MASALVELKWNGLRIRYWASNSEYADELVPFVYTPTQFGGRRQWLSCLHCRRRVRVMVEARSPARLTVRRRRYFCPQ